MRTSSSSSTSASSTFRGVATSKISCHDLGHGGTLRHLDQIEAQERVEIEFPEDPDDIQFEPEPLNDSHIVRGPAFALSRFQPVAQQRDGLGRRIIDEAFAWNDVHSLSLAYESVITFLRTYRT